MTAGKVTVRARGRSRPLAWYAAVAAAGVFVVLLSGGGVIVLLLLRAGGTWSGDAGDRRAAAPLRPHRRQLSAASFCGSAGGWSMTSTGCVRLVERADPEGGGPAALSPLRVAEFERLRLAVQGFFPRLRASRARQEEVEETLDYVLRARG